nr:ankyrin repeat domain-containing protein [Neorhodopirellula lusitana]
MDWFFGSTRPQFAICVAICFRSAILEGRWPNIGRRIFTTTGKRGTKRCNRAAKSGVLKWLIFRRRRLIVTVIRLKSMADTISPPTALFAALERFDDAAAIRAIEAGGDVNARDSRPYMGDGRSPLHVAAMSNNAAMITILLEAGAKANATDDMGQTPLWLACSNADYRAVEALLAGGADASIPARSGGTPMEYVSKQIGRYMAVLTALERNEGG